MNADHSDAIDVYARAFAKATDDGWSLIGIDAEGIDIACGDDSRRVFFAEPLGSAGELRQTLVGLAQQGSGDRSRINCLDCKCVLVL